MKVLLDQTKCDGFGTCAAIMPELFKLDEWGYAYLQGDGELDPAQRDLCEQAVVQCSVNAISIVEP